MKRALSAFRTRKEPQFSPASPGGVAVLKIVNAALVHGVELELQGGLLPSHIDQIEVYVNETKLMAESGSYFADVFNLYPYDNDAAVSRQLFIDFQNPLLANMVNALETSINLGPVDPNTGIAAEFIQIDVTLADDAPAGAKLAAYSVVGGAVAGMVGDKLVGGPGLVPRVVRHTLPKLVIGENELDTIVRTLKNPQTRYIEKIVIGLPLDQIEKVEIKNGEDSAHLFRPVPDAIRKSRNVFATPNRTVIDMTDRFALGRFEAHMFDNMRMIATLKDGANPLPDNADVTVHYSGDL